MICVSKHRLKAIRSTKCRLIEIYVTKSGHTWRFTKLNADKQKSEVPNADIQRSTRHNADTEKLQLIIERLSMLNADTERSMEPTENMLLSTQN